MTNKSSPERSLSASVISPILLRVFRNTGGGSRRFCGECISVRELGIDLAQDIGGALLFGVPLIYTMEVWWLGQRSDLSVLAGVVVLTALASGVVRYAIDRRASWFEAMLVGLRSTTLSLLLAGVFAFVLGIIRPDSSPSEALGIVGAIGVPLALGSVLGAVLFANPDGDDDDGASEKEASNPRGMAHIIFASALGAAFVSLPIAPTEEVPMVAAALDGWRAIATIVAGCLACYIVLFASGFLQKRTSGSNIEPMEAIALSSTVIVVGLTTAAVLLAVGGNLQLDDSTARIIGNICALSMPAIIGASAGRLAAA